MESYFGNVNDDEFSRDRSHRANDRVNDLFNGKDLNDWFDDSDELMDEEPIVVIRFNKKSR